MSICQNRDCFMKQVLQFFRTVGWKKVSILFQNDFVDSSPITRRGREAEEEPECKQKNMIFGTNSIRPDRGKHLG